MSCGSSGGARVRGNGIRALAVWRQSRSGFINIADLPVRFGRSYGDRKKGCGSAPLGLQEPIVAERSDDGRCHLRLALGAANCWPLRRLWLRCERPWPSGLERRAFYSAGGRRQGRRREEARTETEAPLRVAPSQTTMGYHNRGVCRGGGSGRGRRQGGEGSPERPADVRALGAGYSLTMGLALPQRAQRTPSRPEASTRYRRRRTSAAPHP